MNRCTGRGIQQPSLEVYADGEMRSFHALDDDWASSFRDSGRHWLRWLHTGEGPMLWSATEAIRHPAVRAGCLCEQRSGGCRRGPGVARVVVKVAPRSPRAFGSAINARRSPPISGRAGNDSR